MQRLPDPDPQHCKKVYRKKAHQLFFDTEIQTNIEILHLLEVFMSVQNTMCLKTKHLCAVENTTTTDCISSL